MLLVVKDEEGTECVAKEILAKLEHLWTSRINTRHHRSLYGAHLIENDSPIVVLGFFKFFLLLSLLSFYDFL